MKRSLIHLSLSLLALGWLGGTARAAANLIVNGEFDHGLSSFQTVVVSAGSFKNTPPFPHFDVTSQGIFSCQGAPSGPYLRLDVPENADGIVEQRVKLPNSDTTFSFLTWGNLDSATVSVSVVPKGGSPQTLDSFLAPPVQSDDHGGCTGNSPVRKSYSLAAFKATDVTIRLEATSAGFNGAIANVDQLCISASGSCLATPTPTSTTTPTPTRTPTPTSTGPTVVPTPKPPSPGAARKCRAALVDGVSALLQEEAKAERTCADKVVSGKLPHGTDCRTEPKTAATLAKARTKLADTIGKGCGGNDKTCGAGNDDLPLANAGWQALTCPNVAGAACTNAIADCGGVATCLTCIGEAVVDQAIGLYYAALVPTDPKLKSDKALNKCQATIGKATTAFLIAKSKALDTCWDAVNGGQAVGLCPDAGGKTVDAIAKAEAKKVAAICKACGGANKLCGDGDDFTPAEIGFAGTCPAVDVPGAAASCAAGITTLQNVVDCVDCVTEFDVDCATLVAVPFFTAYPPACVGP